MGWLPVEGRSAGSWLSSSRLSLRAAPRRPADPPKVVIKRVSVKDLPEDERRAARREAEILRHLGHPAILRHIESFEDDGHLCLVTEFCERGDMTALLAARRGAPLPEPAVLDYLAQMLLGLLYCHKVGLGGLSGVRRDWASVWGGARARLIECALSQLLPVLSLPRSARSCTAT